jgi:hypothetical protein
MWKYKELTGSWEGAVLSYNAGLTQYRTGHIPYSTRDYFSFIFSFYMDRYK